MNIKQYAVSSIFLHSLLWGFLAPQSLLITINLNGWNLVKGEANASEVSVALQIISFETIIIIATFVTFLLLKFSLIRINWKLLLASLITHVGYIFFFIFNLGDAIPNTIQPWILSEGNVGRWNITLLMPGAFLSLFALTRISFSSIKKSTGKLLVIVLTLGVPIVWYLVVSLMQPLWLGQFTTAIGIAIGVISATVFLAAVIRIFDNLLHKDSSGRFVAKHYIIAVLLGLAAPLGGLTLDDAIPFPADFQLTIIYLLTELNGLVLILKPTDSALAPFRLFLRCIFLPFIFYIFFVFLPFLPLSLFAILLVGAGLLMLTPLALGLFQANVTKTEFDFSVNRVGVKKSAFIALAGILILPSYFIAQTLLDKTAIEMSLNYFYSHDSTKPTLTDQQIKRASSSLVQLRDRKDDVQLPYISGIYNSIVFGELVLPDNKIRKMYRWLTNNEIPKAKTSMFNSKRPGVNRIRGARLVDPNRNVTIQDISLKQSKVTDHKTSLHLILKNNHVDTHSIFIEQLYIPDGVFVTGLWLKIEDEWVEGRIFDKKTALWVFKKITEERKDPALLHYLSANVLELRVYPFPEMGIREVKVDFEFHSAIDSDILIGEHQIDLNPEFNEASILSDMGKVIATGLDAHLFKRNPYLHFILDYSIGAKLSVDETIEKISKVSKELNISNLKITAANIGSSEQQKTPILNIDERSTLEASIRNIKLKERAGLWVQQAISKQIVRASNTLNEENVKQIPIFVIIGGKQIINKEMVNLRPWSWLIPDMKNWYSLTNGRLEKHELSLHNSAKVGADPSLVVAIKNNAKIFIFHANTSSMIETTDNEKYQIFSPTKNQFVNIEVNPYQNDSDASWSTYAQIWTNWRNTNLNPAAIESKRIEFHALSRKNNFLLPLTSFIVVESESQWEILRRKEKQGLNNHSSLEFDNQEQTSEPPWWVMLVCVLGYLFYRRRFAEV